MIVHGEGDSPRGRERIEDARPEDVAALANLWVAAWQAAMPAIDFEARRGWFLDNFRSRTASGARTLVLPEGSSQLDHRDIGSNRSNVTNVIDPNHLERDYCEKPVPTFSHPALGFVMIDPQTGYLDQIAVAPDVTGSGAAAKLLAAAKAVAPRGIDLDVNTENARAVAFYRKHGFVVAGRGVNPNSGRPTLRMQWRPA